VVVDRGTRVILDRTSPAPAGAGLFDFGAFNDVDGSPKLLWDCCFHRGLAFFVFIRMAKNRVRFLDKAACRRIDPARVFDRIPRPLGIALKHRRFAPADPHYRRDGAVCSLRQQQSPQVRVTIHATPSFQNTAHASDKFGGPSAPNLDHKARLRSLSECALRQPCLTKRP